ncbi:hypothetical protein RJ640_020617 [Escallonia rubra]|uniref:GAG-pre-integrase domain-containing protein n=1 Tax=Escallonia rubra TaxID=112253 RepID=A0AA88QKE6_9ASTE|nr:hypothetical protein RJ640_020617 [Escallonia rubra]
MGSKNISMGNNSSEEVLGDGSYQLKLRTGCILLLEDVRYAPTVRLNLLSVTALLDNDFSFIFQNNKLDILLDNVLFGHGFHMDSLFQLDLIDSQSFFSYVVNDKIVNDSATWHARLGQIGQDRMTRLAKEGLLGPLAKVNLQTCEACLAGKACRKPFGKVVRVTQPFELVHSDIYGPMSVKRVIFLYELEEVEATLPSPSKGGELVSHLVVAEDSISDSQPSGSTPPGPSDICYAVGMACHYQSNSGPLRWNVVKRILRYLRKTVDLFLCYLGGDLRLRGYNDADWGVIEMGANPLQVMHSY